LWSIPPLDPEKIDKARSGTAPRWFGIADAASVVLAVAGLVFALATVRPRRWATGMARPMVALAARRVHGAARAAVDPR
jgi:hypothetical protein